MRKSRPRARHAAKPGDSPAHDSGRPRHKHRRLGAFAAAWPSGAYFLLAAGGSIEFCVSGNVFAEYAEVVQRPRLRRPENVVTSTLKSIHEEALWVRPTETIRICSDPDDDMFLECASAAQATFLVTGNIRHFPTTWSNIEIVTPRRFLNIVSGDFEPR